ncbi:coiled-coil domain-containing protein [Legionella sp. D16C41]|uniref:coiled-coil domain-containing protein n=1 Tax=Legionella sp. D16C41 TaxID=3402688 RepID=UPI003AF82205
MFPVFKNITKVQSIMSLKSAIPVTAISLAKKPIELERAFSTKRVTISDKKFGKIITEAAKLEGIEQQKYQQGFSEYYKVKEVKPEIDKPAKKPIFSLKTTSMNPHFIFANQLKTTQLKREPTTNARPKLKADKQSKEAKDLTPNEAANKVVEISLSKTKPYLGNMVIKFIEYPFKAYARSKLEPIFIVLSKDGRVNENLVNKVSSHALQLFFILLLMYIAEKLREQKAKIEKLEGEVEDLNESYNKGLKVHKDMREKIIKKSEKLLKYQEEATKYESILIKLKEAQKATDLKHEKQTTLESIRESVSSFMVNDDERLLQEVKSYLTEQDTIEDNVAAKQTLRELEKVGKVHSLVIKAEDKLDDLNSKKDKVEEEISKLNSVASMYANHIQYIGAKRDNRVKEVEKILGYTFFKKTEDSSLLPDEPVNLSSPHADMKK